jgi:hypothetical protein
MIDGARFDLVEPGSNAESSYTKEEDPLCGSAPMLQTIVAVLDDALILRASR